MVLKAHEPVGPVVHLVRLEHEVGDGHLNAADEVVRRQGVRVPQLDRELLAGAHLVVRDEEEARLLPDGVEVFMNDAGAEERLSELRIGNNDVWIARAVVVLSGEAGGVVDRDHEDAESLRVALDAVTGQHLGLRGDRARQSGARKGTNCPNAVHRV